MWLINGGFVKYNIKASRILIFYKMVKFPFEYCFVRIALSFPVFNEKLLYTRLLLLKSFHCDLLTVRKIDTVEIFARLSLLIFRHFLINWLPHLFDVEVKHVKFLFFLIVSLSLLLLFGIGSERIHLRDFFHLQEFFVYFCKTFSLWFFMINRIVEPFDHFETNMSVLLASCVNSLLADVWLDVTDYGYFLVGLNLIKSGFILSNFWRHSFARVSWLPCISSCRLKSTLYLFPNLDIFQ